MSGTVIFLGAGATKSCGGPMTNEILPQVVGGPAGAPAPVPDTAGRLPHLQAFLQQLFHVSPGDGKESYPGLPLLMSLLDTALERRQPLHPAWDANAISEIRQAVELGIFDALEEALLKAPTNNHYELLWKFFPAPAEPCIISTNYDLIIDTAMMFTSEQRLPDGALPNYHCAISTPFYKNEKVHYGTLLKLHGSLNWLHCRTCHRLEIGASESRRFLKVLGRLVGPPLEQTYTPDGSLCPVCQTKLRPLLVAPTHLKDYRNPHLAQVWYEAEHVLRKSNRAVFIGYSLPEDDVEVIYLLKRSLAHLAPSQITVVEYDPTVPPSGTHPVGRRYRTLFGDGIDWHPEGMDSWLATVEPPA
ncbi:MAG TPA: hypothetical protein VGX68_21865 [Thermoanaerobaculia bacterium]|jgi:hypothetical protein|nr:hypothetical protein [Thermoanaerobaculia bacterium]